MSDGDIAGPREAEAAEWSQQQWEQWFRDEVMATSDWRVLEADWSDAEQEFEVDRFYDQYLGKETFSDPQRNFATDPLTGEIDPDLLSGVRALANVMDKGVDVYAALLRESWEHAFARISSERRMRFFRGWNRVQAHQVDAAGMRVARGAAREVAASARDAAPASQDDPRSGWGRSQYWVNITLPNGNVATLPTGTGPSSPGASDFDAPEITVTEPNRDATPPPVAPEEQRTPAAASGSAPAVVPGVGAAPARRHSLFGLVPLTGGCLFALVGGLAALAVVAVLALGLFSGGDDEVAVPSDTAGSGSNDASGQATSTPGRASGGGPSDVGVEIEVLKIGDEHFYRYIFDELGSPASGRYTCGADQYAVHLDTSHPVARSFEHPDVAVPDPAPGGCGFGETVTFTTNGRVVNPSTSALDPEFPRLRFTARVIGEWCRYTLDDLTASGASSTAVENLCRRNPPQD